MASALDLNDLIISLAKIDIFKCSLAYDALYVYLKVYYMYECYNVNYSWYNLLCIYCFRAAKYLNSFQ